MEKVKPVAVATNIDYLQAVKDKKTELKDLHARMDQDRDLVYLSKYTLTDVDGNPVPNSVSITLNDPAVFATNVESSLSNSTEQVAVESEDKKLDTDYIEDVVRAGLAEASDRLVKQGRFPLNPFFDQQMCRRGRGVARCLCREVDGQLVVDIVPWDSRFVYYAMGPNGLLWAAYETYKSKGEIEAEAWAQEIKFTITGKGETVLDVWDGTHNVIYVAEKQEYEQPHNFGVTPVALQLVPMGSMLADKDTTHRQGESIFFLIRDLVPELNRLISIIQSLNLKALDNALQWKVPTDVPGGVPDVTPPEFDKLTRPGSITTAPMGGGAEPISYGELNREAYLLHTMIETRIQRGSVSNLDMGIMGNQPWSAVSLITLGEGRDQVFLPRLGARGLLNGQLARMMIEQIINSGLGNFEIGTPGHKRIFTAVKLQGEYEVSFKYFIKSPQIDVARYSMAVAAGDLISDKAKRRDILQREDPEQDERDLRWQEAEELSPAIKMNRDIQALLEMAERGDPNAAFEAEILSTEMGVNLQQMMSGNVNQQPTPEKKETKPLVPLFGGGGGGGPSSSQKAADIKGTPRAEGGEG